MASEILLTTERAERSIFLIRGHKVILDTDLAALYEVATKRLNEQVKRNVDRFPPDFMFQLTKAEKDEVVANCDHLERLKFSPTLPYAFTEHGAMMAASVLKSQRAIEMSVFVVRAFVRMREALSAHAEIAQKLNNIERRLSKHDRDIQEIVNAIRELMSPNDPPKKRQIGFAPEGK